MLLNFCCFEGKAALYSSSSTVLLIAILMQVINNKVPLTNLNRKCYSRKQAVIAIGTINCCFTLCLFAHLYYLFLILPVFDIDSLFVFRTSVCCCFEV